MDILKARQKAKERQGQAATRPPTTAPTSTVPAPTTTGPLEPASPAPGAAPIDAPVTTPAAQPTSTPHPADTGAARSSITEHGDPLAEFLAVYDDGEPLIEEVEEELEAPVEDERRFLSFDLAGEPYAVSIMDVGEILRLVTITEVPRAPPEVLGVISKRGTVMPVIDVAAVIGLRPADRNVHKEDRVLVVGDGDRVCGLRVDRVRQVVRLGQRAIEEVPPSLGSKNAHMLIGLGRVRVDPKSPLQMLILLDVRAVLQHFAESMGIETPRIEERV